MQNILFDLDGTLLPMNQEKFVTFYLPLLAEKMKKYDISTNDLISAVWKGSMQWWQMTDTRQMKMHSGKHLMQ